MLEETSRAAQGKSLESALSPPHGRYSPAALAKWLGVYEALGVEARVLAGRLLWPHLEH